MEGRIRTGSESPEPTNPARAAQSLVPTLKLALLSGLVLAGIEPASPLHAATSSPVEPTKSARLEPMAVSPKVQEAETAEFSPSDATETVERLIAAFNRAAAEEMAELVAHDFELFYVGNDGRAVTGAEGRVAFLEQMKQYFASYPNVKSRAENVVPGPIFIAYRERIVEGPGAGQSSIAVYEVRDRLIQRAWYYPTEPPPTDP